MTACAEIRVLEVSDGFGAAGLCGQLFANLGARVVKAELHEGDSLRGTGPLAPDGCSYQHYLLHAAKECVRLPSGAPAAAIQLTELIAEADVIIVDGLPAVLFESDIAASPQAFCARWPAKVLCTTSTFGSHSSRNSWIGNELIAQAMGGIIATNGYPERQPVRSGVPYAMHVTALFAFDGIMAALREQGRSEKGQWLDLAAVDCLISLLGNYFPSYFLSGRSPKRIGNRHTIAAPWNLYPARDGYVVICTGTGGSGWWKKITQAMDRTDLTDDPRYDNEASRVARVEEVDAIVGEWTQVRNAAEIVEVLTEAEIPASEINSVEAVLADPHYREVRGMFGMATFQGDGQRHFKFPVVGSPIKVGTWAPSTAPAPAPQARATRPASVGEGVSAPRGRPLDGSIRILEFGSRTSVPLAAHLLADLGADVIKIEPKKGEPLRGGGQPVGGSSYLFHINNGGKRSVVIEPSVPEGRDLILKLAAKADVWLENLAPGALESMGIGYEALRAINPGIIYVSVSGFGLKSNYGKKRALDTVVQAACGIMHLTGYPDHLPVKLGISAVDLGAAVGLVGTVLSALRQRERKGLGMHVDLAMADIGMWMTQSVWPQIIAENGKPSRIGNRGSFSCPHNIFETTDGLVAIAADTDAQWSRLAQLLGDDAIVGDATLATLKGRLQNVERIEGAITRWLEAKSRDEAAALCQRVGVPAAPVRNLSDIAEDPETARRGMIVEVDHPTAGRIRLLGNPFFFSRTQAPTTSGAPVLGAHTAEILGDWLGLATEEIEALCAAGIVATDSGQTK